MARTSPPRQATMPSLPTSGPASTQALTSARCSASSLRRRPERRRSPRVAAPPVRSRASQRYRVARPMPPARAAPSTVIPSQMLAIARSRTRLRGSRSTRAKARNSRALAIPTSSSPSGAGEHASEISGSRIIPLVPVRLQVVDLDGVVAPFGNTLNVGRVPENGNRTAGIKGQLVVARDLDELSRLDGLAAAWLDRKGQEKSFLRSGLGHAQSL